MMNSKEIILITGSSGFIGKKLATALTKKYHVIGLDQSPPNEEIPGLYFHQIDMTSADNIRRTLQQIKEDFGHKIHSAVHLVAYYDFRGEPDEKYQTLTVEGSCHLLQELDRQFEVGKFIFSSSMLIYEPVPVGEKITADSPVKRSWPYPDSKIDAEKAMAQVQGNIPLINVRIAGVYNDHCHQPTISQQIMRIYEGWLTSFFFPGNPESGQSFIHVDDLTDGLSRMVDDLVPQKKVENYLLGEEEVVSFRDIQKKVGMLIHQKPWPTFPIPAFVARIGAGVMDHLPIMREPFIKPWMVSHADENFDIDMGNLKKKIHWQPQRRLSARLELMVENLKKDPEAWYKINKIEKPFYRDLRMIGNEGEKNFFLTALVNIFLGVWIFSNSFTLGKLSTPEFYSEALSGLFITLLAAVSLIPTLRWTRWINTLLGSWLLFSPLVFFSDSSALYSNDTLLGALVILLSAYSPTRDKSLGVPPGWSYNPSTAGQRIPIMFLAFIGFLLSRYMAAYQLGHIENVWDPFFSPGTKEVLTSEVSRAFPVSDAGLGALAYLLDLVSATVGGRDRWRSLPWAVILFGFLIIPSGVVSITLIMLQPISVGAWCTLCLITAFIMLIMVPPAVDEVLASVQFLKRRVEAGESFWKVFFLGGPDEGIKLHSRIKKRGSIIHLYFATLIGMALMFAPTYFEMEKFLSNSTYIVAALIITFSIISLSEVTRILRFLNIPLGFWLMISGVYFTELANSAEWTCILSGLLLILLSLPYGKQKESFGPANNFIHWTPFRRKHEQHG